MLKDIIQRKIIKAFDRWAPRYTKNVQAKLCRRGYSYKDLSLHILSEMTLPRNGLVLEIGTGTGVLGRHIMSSSSIPIRLIGIDISKEMLKIASKTRCYKSLYCANAENLPFDNNSFDGIFSTFVLHSVINQVNSLKEIHRVLKPKAIGILVDLCPNISSHPWITLIKGNLHSFYFEYGAPSCYRTQSEYSSLIENSGLNLLKVKQLGQKRSYTHYLFKICKKQ